MAHTIQCHRCGESPRQETPFSLDLTQITRLRHLLRLHSSSPPSLQSEILDFQSVITSAPAGNPRYDTDMQMLRTALDRMLSKRPALQPHADGCRSVVARTPSGISPQSCWSRYSVCAKPRRLMNWVKIFRYSQFGARGSRSYREVAYVAVVPGLFPLEGHNHEYSHFVVDD
jgi:hypothetical protein